MQTYVMQFSVTSVMYIQLVYFFVDKKKTAYELNECDGNSDVCASDLSDREK